MPPISGGLTGIVGAVAKKFFPPSFSQLVPALAVVRTFDNELCGGDYSGDDVRRHALVLAVILATYLLHCQVSVFHSDSRTVHRQSAVHLRTSSQQQSVNSQMMLLMIL